ncbi:hypothetical protein CQ018_15435 [Arthrobacter sp. MYb227]|uniref:hypothetical protein n=1 Tax=Arthrobacter sp. MYb227 TaxID=1848601 RepID=UPI000CFB4626|nr:hypothetical protein [Arthrobacter sp. MYb227]PQZ89549.1 hypothetical protein CQ018_15435 [Arthrobacter sp. MYb227]
MTLRTPQKYADEAENKPQLPSGNAERFSGYALMGMPFGAGRYLAYRRFTASSIGPAYHAVWLRRSDGRWSVYADAPPELSCNRYFGAAFSQAIRRPVDGNFTGPFTLEIAVPGVLEWRIELEITLVSGSLSKLAGSIPAKMWHDDRILRTMGAAMGPVLRAGKLGMAGHVPNGQWFRARPLQIWTVKTSAAVVDGKDIGMPQPLEVQEQLGDFWLPQRGLFVAEMNLEFPSTAADAPPLPESNKIMTSSGQSKALLAT